MSDFARRILHEDEQLLVVDKPAGLLTVGHPGAKGRCLLDELRAVGRPVAPVHRLDRETSGLVLLSLAPHALRAALEDAFRERRVEKTYLALVLGTPQSARARLELPILDEGKTARVDRRGRKAVTSYVIEKRFEQVCLLRCKLETGRHNQIRAHLAHIGHPLVGDRKFGHHDARLNLVPASRTLLHAAELALDHPGTGERMQVCAPLPDDMRNALAEAAPELSSGRAGRVNPSRASSARGRAAGRGPRRRPPRR